MLNRRIGVLLGGLALGLAYPKIGWWPLAFVALVPLIVAAGQVRAAPRAFGLGVLFGVGYRAVTLYWLVHTMHVYGGLALPLAVLGYLLLVLYLAAYQGAFALAAARVPNGSVRAGILLATVWTALEYVQSWLFTGFPWVLLGYTGGASGVLVQAADLFGVWGLSFLVVLVNFAVAAALAEGLRARPAAVGAAVLLLAWGGYGGWRLSQATALGDAALTVGMLQGNVPQDLKWDPDAKEATLSRHLQLAAEAADRGARLVVWPESSWPDAYGAERDPVARVRLPQLADSTGAAQLVGTVHVEDAGDGFTVSNSATLLDGAGRWRGRYDKSHLVPFGEYLPLQRWLRFLGPLVQAVGVLAPGGANQPLLSVPEQGIDPFGLAICYEIIFPNLVRSQVARGARFLVTITNDAWYGTSSGPYQHFAMVRLRAVENRRYLVRAANTGISGIVDPWGRVLQRSELETEAVLVGQVEGHQAMSLYASVGDVLPRACLLVTLLGAGLALRRRDHGA